MRSLTSRRHPFVAACRAAAGGTDLQGTLLLDGDHLVAEALAAGVVPTAAAITRSFLTRAGAHGQDLVHALERAGATLYEVATEVMDAASPTRSPSGIVALAPRPAARTLSTAAGSDLVLVAVGIQEPGNLGAVVRVCDAAGVATIVVSGASADPYGWKALRGAMGSAFRLPIAIEADPAAALQSLARSGLSCVATAPDAATSIYDVDLTGPTALVIGGEGAGLSSSLRALATLEVRIPMRPGVDSLNVATAAAVAVYEARRQRCASR